MAYIIYAITITMLNYQKDPEIIIAIIISP